MNLIEKYGRAQLGIDGNAAFALLGPDLQEGECEFVTIPPELESEIGEMCSELVCAKMALAKLKATLGLPQLSFFFGPRYPMGR